MGRNDVGVVGLSVMGGNLAMNLADAGFSVGVFNRSRERTEVLVDSYRPVGQVGSLNPSFEIEAFVESLALPRKVLLMVQAGEAVDEVIGKISPFLSEGDIVIDGGNSFFKDTIRREQSLREKGIHFVGMGVSGGEEGARRGPSIMPGGSEASWNILKPLLERIAAKDFSGGPCVSHIGTDGSGHYVKMTHNGIEYVDMQLITETYQIMREGLRMENEPIADTLSEWNNGRLESFLIGITETILRAKYDDGTSVVDSILDSAGSKGTGMWTAREAVELGIPAQAITGALFARYGSSMKNDRLSLSRAYASLKMPSGLDIPLDTLERALYAAKLLAYAQGFALLSEASRTYGWKLDFSEIARIWQGGCIIRARFLQSLSAAFSSAEPVDHILALPIFLETLSKDIPALREVVSAAVAKGFPVPALSGSLTYFESMTQASSSANIIQAQRDFFGAHGFQKEIGGEFFHHSWPTV